MKLFVTVGLGVSLALNVALAALFVTGRSNERAAANASASTVSAAAAPATPTVDADVWPSLRSEDLPTQVARLKAAGFPREVIRAILETQLGDAITAQRRAIEAGAENQNYWKEGPRDPRSQLALNKLYRENEKKIRELVGEDSSDESNIWLERRMKGVPTEKVAQVKEIIRSFDEKRSDLYTGGFEYMADGAKMRELNRAQRDVLAAILSPQELEQYEMRSSDLANNLRYQLGAFDPTEDEYRTIYRLQQAMNDKVGDDYYGGPRTAEQMRQREEAQKQFQEQVKAALGPERAADYERSISYDYQQTSRLVARLELPPETTKQVWDVQQDIQKRARALQRDNTLSPEQMAQQLNALNEETQTRVTTLLGDQGYQAYRQYGGSWMRVFQPPKNRPNG